jgi:hypothetical protein
LQAHDLNCRGGRFGIVEVFAPDALERILMGEIRHKAIRRSAPRRRSRLKRVTPVAHARLPDIQVNSRDLLDLSADRADALLKTNARPFCSRFNKTAT